MIDSIKTAQHGNAKAATYQIQQSNSNKLRELTEAGLALVAIPPVDGKPTKAPRSKGWNKPRSPDNPDGYTANLDDLSKYDSKTNFGLHHGANNTLALDLDNVELSKQIFEALADNQLLDWLEQDKRLEIKSPKPNHGKLLFKLPEGFNPPGVKQYKTDEGVVFELRCGDGAQDVIIGQHPEGGSYQFVGNPAAIPEAPPVLLDMLQNWDAWKPCLDSALGIELEPPKIAPQHQEKGGQLLGRRDPIQEFNQSYGVSEVLIRNGYQRKGLDRFIRPNSESKAPGVAIMRNCADGIERIYSHGGDVLNDGYAHDAFDCFRLLECGGDLTQALTWNPDITNHNQKLYMQEKAVDLPKSLDKKAPFPLVPANDLTKEPTPIDWLLKNIIERGSVNLLFGEPGAGKSLFALDWAFCVALGINWHGLNTKPVDVVIVAGEGHAGLGRRLKALEAKYGTLAPASIYISKRPANLKEAQDAKWIADTIKDTCPNPGLIIIDTLHRNMNGDENSSQDIGQFIANLDVYFKPLGAAVLVVHHSGHGQKDRSRGSSSIRAAMDAEFCVSKEGMTSVLTCTKSKDFEGGSDVRFGIKQVELEWQDEEGLPLTSVYLEYVGEAKQTPQKVRLSIRDEMILTSLSDALEEHGVEPPAEIKTKFGFDALLRKHEKVVTIEDWRQYAYKVIEVDSDKGDAKQKPFKRCRDKLIRLKFIWEYDGYVWRIFDL